MVERISRLVLLLFVLAIASAPVLSGCDFASGSSANTLAATPTAQAQPTPPTLAAQPSGTPADPPTAAMPPAGAGPTQVIVSGAAASTPAAGNTTTPVPAQSPSQASSGRTVEYTVVDGDTLSSIAARFSTSVDALMQINGISDPNLVYVGQVLTIAQVDGQGSSAPVPSDTPRPKLPTPTKAAAQASPTVEAAAEAPAQSTPGPDATLSSGKMVNGQWYDAYVPAATKLHQYYHYTCEFDAAWVVLKTNGIDATLQDQLAITGQDKNIEPRYEETANGVFIYGGDILHYYSGDYTSNFLARSTGAVIARVFEHYGLKVTPVHTQDAMEAALRQGQLVWIKTTADFKPGRPATWVMPDGTTYQTVLGNDHAAVVMGYSERGALIRDVLGPTSTNWNRQYEYEVPWPKFMAAWDQQQDDGLAVGR